MDPNYRVLRDNRLSAHKVPIPPRAFGLGHPGVLRLQTLEQGLNRLREARVGSGLRCPGCVTTRGGHGKQSEHGETRGLPLKGHIGVEARRGEVALSNLPPIWVIRT